MCTDKKNGMSYSSYEASAGRYNRQTAVMLGVVVLVAVSKLALLHRQDFNLYKILVLLLFSFIDQGNSSLFLISY